MVKPQPPIRPEAPEFFADNSFNSYGGQDEPETDPKFPDLWSAHFQQTLAVIASVWS
jgi:hypothetical protein